MSSSRVSDRYSSTYGTTYGASSYTSAPTRSYETRPQSYTTKSYAQAPTTQSYTKSYAQPTTQSYTTQSYAQAPTTQSYTSQSYAQPTTQSYTSQSYTSSSRSVPNQKWGIRIPTSEEGRLKVEEQIKGGYGGGWGGATVTTEHDGQYSFRDEQQSGVQVRYSNRDHRDNRAIGSAHNGPHVTIVGRGEQVLVAEKKVLSILGQHNQTVYHPTDVDLTDHEPRRHHEGSYNKWGHKVACTEAERQKIESQIRNGGFGGATVSTELDGCYGPTVVIMGTEEQVVTGKRKVAAILGDRVDDHHEDVHYKKIEVHPRHRWQETVKQAPAPIQRKAATVNVPVTHHVVQEVTESEGEY